MTTNNNNRSFFEELKRRNVYRVGVAYAVLTWALLQVIDTVAPIIALPEWAPKLILTLLAIGFPVAMLFAWAYELTPEGLKREKDVDRSQSITSHTGQRLDRITIGVLVVAVGLLLVDKFLLTEAPQVTNVVAEEVMEQAEVAPSIAVLPFVNMSDDKSSTYFSDGLADTVLHMLAQVREIRVAARTSSFQFRDTTTDIADIGSQLNVGTILEGSVQRAGNKVRITAQLIDVSSGFHLWSGNFDRDLDDIFAIQDEIASEVVTALKVSLLGDSVERLGNDQTDNIDAYAEYLLAINDLDVLSSRSMTSAALHLQAAIRLDPDYARAYTVLGRTYLHMGAYGSMGEAAAVAAARNMASRALDLAPDSSEALAILGQAELIDGDQDAAGKLLEKAIENGPNDAVALTTYAVYLASNARPTEAIAAFQQALRLDPLSEIAYIGLAVTHRNQANYFAADETITKYLSVNPNSSSAVALAASIEFRQGNIAVAISEMTAAQELDPDDPEPSALLARFYLAIDMPDAARRWFDRAVEIDPQHPVSQSAPLYLNYYLQANVEESFQLARKLLEDRVDSRDGSRIMALAVMTEHAARTGRHEIALAVLDNLYPHLFDDPPHDLERESLGTLFVGIALMQSGDIDRGSLLLRAYLDFRETRDDAYLVARSSVQASLMLGDIDRALEKLDTFAAGKYYADTNRLFLEHDVTLDPLRGDPAFIKILDDYRKNAEEQRLLLQAMNENSSN